MSALDYLPLGPQQAEFFTDFLTDVETESANSWTVASINGSATFTTLDTVQGGVAQLTPGATTDTHGGLASLSAAPIFLTAGTKVWFGARLKIATATDCDIFAGLGGGAISTISDYTDFLGFIADDTATAEYWDAAYKIASGTRGNFGANIALVDTSYHVFAMYVDVSVSGTATVAFYIDGVEVLKKYEASVPAGTVAIRPMFGTKNGATAASILTIDWVGVKFTR